MKDNGTNVQQDECKANREENELKKGNNIIEKEINGAPDDDDVDKLSNVVKELNIKADEDDKDEDDLLERGPVGGIPVLNHTPKNLPVGPYGNYQPSNGYVPMPNENGRRGFDVDDYEPAKFRRGQPQISDYQQMGGYHFNNLNGPDGFNQVFTHNTALSGGNVVVNSPTQNPPSIADALLEAVVNSQQNIPPPQSHPLYQTNLSHQYQAPMASTPDDFVMSPTSSVGSVNMTSPSSRKDGRRQSDPVDSGVESAEEKSPYSDVAPSPTGSNYSYPPSVESGYGRSPKHETTFGQGTQPMTSSQYPGIMSPGSNRLTPSPASSAGYNSPKHQTDNNDFFTNPETEEDLRLAMEIIDKDMEESCNRKPPGRPPLPVNPLEQPAPIYRNQLINQPMTHQMSSRMLPNQQLQQMQQHQQLSGFPPSGPPVQRIPPGQGVQPAPIPANILPGPITSTGAVAPQSIIIVQQPPQTTTNNTAPFIVLTQVPNKLPEKVPKKPRKILPKGSVSTNGSTVQGSNANGITTTSPSNTSNIMTPRVGVPVHNKMGQQPSPGQVKQDRLLMIARRTVAGMTDEDLKKMDDEGDTYLHIAVCKTDKHMVQALLERLHRQKLDHLVDQENNKRQTPLYLAVYINQPVMVAMFIKFQANVNVLAQSLSSDGLTREVKAAIHVASSQGHEYVDTLQQLLLAKDISINIVNNYGQTALHCAIAAHNRVKRNSEERINSLAIIKMLIKAGADVSAQDQKSGKTPLMYAIEQRDLNLVETILCCIEPSKMRNVVRTQAFDGSSCLKIAEGLKDSYNIQAWNKLWNSLQSAASGTIRIQPTVF